MSEERRHFNRVTFNTSASFYVDGKEYKCNIIDLSIHGALIEVVDKISIKKGTKCHLDIPLSDDDQQIKIDLEVMHLNGNKLGLMNQQIGLDSITYLRRVVELNSGDPQLLEREFVELIHQNTGQ
ncbi:MAG: PilZ domain-containing protein [Gammaproteobacteria bacterium]|nr:PilZ domain-containing protein [Gammaproteobacteria bacterium]MDH5630571.1 PilZ domain-containing protein [Gammaproteobacteria bacterium]